MKLRGRRVSARLGSGTRSGTQVGGRSVRGDGVVSEGTFRGLAVAAFLMLGAKWVHGAAAWRVSTGKVERRVCRGTGRYVVRCAAGGCGIDLSLCSATASNSSGTSMQAGQRDGVTRLHAFLPWSCKQNKHHAWRWWQLRMRWAGLFVRDRAVVKDHAVAIARYLVWFSCKPAIIARI